ncbi:MAG: AAA family ATPase [Atopobiaceae bacterium]|nr:AAA family ATPase [Atopobiaceae bacterium]
MLVDYTPQAYANQKRLPLDYLKQAWGVMSGNWFGTTATAIPWRDAEGQVFRWRFRLADENGRKEERWGAVGPAYEDREGRGYDHYRGQTSGVPNDRLPLYGCDKVAQDTPYLLLVEGESDVETLHYCDFPAVGVPGASCFGECQAEFIREHFPNAELMVCKEPDQGGETLVASVADHWGGPFEIITLGRYKDPSEAFMDLGRDEAQMFISNALAQAETQGGEPAAKAGELPPLVSLSEVWGNLPPRAEPIIGDERDGLLRKGHVLLVNAPSKAGKSWLLDELGVCMSSGRPWLGYPCRRLPVLFCDFELDRPSFYNRLKIVADAMGGAIDPSMIDTLSLRGHTASTEELTDHIIAEASIMPSGYYGLLIIDPLYMFSVGDENSASDTRQVMRQIGRLATTLGCAVGLSHHNAKGLAGAKNAIDRSSGSGVFSRFPDALIDLAPVRVPDDADLDPDATVWRLTPTLREFRPQKPTTWVFQWPLHRPYPEGNDWAVIGSPEDNRQRGGKAHADAEAEKVMGWIVLIDKALDRCAEEGTTPTPELVWSYFSELTDEDVKLSTFKSWLRPSRTQYPFASSRDGTGFVVSRTDAAKHFPSRTDAAL